MPSGGGWQGASRDHTNLHCHGGRAGRLAGVEMEEIMNGLENQGGEQQKHAAQIHLNHATPGRELGRGLR